MTARKVVAELLTEEFLGEAGRPGWRVESDFVRRLLESRPELFELCIGEFGRATGRRFVVKTVLEPARFEAIEPGIDRLFRPPKFLGDLRWRLPVEILSCDD